MTTLTINDLSITADLDRKAMAAVRGGHYAGASSYTLPSFGSSKHDLTHGRFVYRSSKDRYFFETDILSLRKLLN